MSIITATATAEEFTLTKGSRRIDQDTNIKVFYRKVVVLADPGCDLSEFAALFRKLEFKVYDDLEASKNHERDAPLWLEAAEAKKAGKPYDLQDWNKFLGRYDAIVTHLAMPYAQELIEAAGNPFAKVIVVTKSPDAPTVARLRSFVSNRVLSMMDPRFILSPAKDFFGNGLLDYAMIRANVTGAQQKLIEIDSFKTKTVCDFIGQPVPRGTVPPVDSMAHVYLRYTMDCIGEIYIHLLNKIILILFYVMTFPIFRRFEPFFVASILFVARGYNLVSAKEPDTPATQSIPPHRRIKKPEAPVTDSIPPHRRNNQPDTATTSLPPHSLHQKAPASNVPPHRRHQKTTSSSDKATPPHLRHQKTTPSATKPNGTGSSNGTKSPSSAIVKSSPGANSNRSKSPAGTSDKSTPTGTSTSGAQTPNSRAQTPNKAATAGDSKSPTQTPTSRAQSPDKAATTGDSKSPTHTADKAALAGKTKDSSRLARAPAARINLWGNFESTIREDDRRVGRENEAKKEAMKDVAPGVWTTIQGPRLVKAVEEAEQKDKAQAAREEKEKVARQEETAAAPAPEN